MTTNRAGPNSLRYIAGIETSCDETSFAIIECSLENLATSPLPAQFRVLTHAVHSQTDLHIPFGGVVPEIAARDHLAKLPSMVQDGFSAASLRATDLSAIAVTTGPGLIGAVMVGSLFAQGMSESSGVPLLAINHVDAHLAPATLCDEFNPTQDIGIWKNTREARFPRLTLTVSGGHCLLGYESSLGSRRILGTTLDDACGEAFDKVAKLLGLGYPGGPAVERCAAAGDPTRFDFALPLTQGNSAIRLRATNPFAFSFSGLKTAVLRTAEELRSHSQRDGDEPLHQGDINDICAAFQQSALAHLCDRLAAAEQYVSEHLQTLQPKAALQEIVIAGGVAANRAFREQAAKTLRTPLFFAPKSLCNDNATMIAMQALIKSLDGTTTKPFSRYPIQLEPFF
jgi:N6-L-threonylcarbamoyladenine synthase